MNELLAAHPHASNHREEIEASTQCACFNCLQMFPPTDIIAWTGCEGADFSDLDSIQGQTALCPHCGSESILGNASGFALTIDFLQRMNQAWMQRTIIRRPKPKA